MNEPYIIICFNANLRSTDDNPEGILKGEPVKGIKNIKRWFEKINYQNTILKSQVGKAIYIEKYNFETMEDLDNWVEKNKTTYTYEGYMSKEALSFFGEDLITEQRNGIPVVGFFLKLKNDKTIMPSKGDVFTRHEDGSLSVWSVHRQFD